MMLKLVIAILTISAIAFLVYRKEIEATLHMSADEVGAEYVAGQDWVYVLIKGIPVLVLHVLMKTILPASKKGLTLLAHGLKESAKKHSKQTIFLVGAAGILGLVNFRLLLTLVVLAVVVATVKPYVHISFRLGKRDKGQAGEAA